jgi:hypothetical protein
VAPCGPGHSLLYIIHRPLIGGRLGERRSSQFSRVTGGFLYKLGVVSYTIRILMYPACILHVSCMYFDVSRS